MPRFFSRIDQKLIHGQVSVAWVPHLGIEVIVVIDEELKGDEWIQRAMKMGLPPEVVHTFFLAPKDLTFFLKSNLLPDKKILFIFNNLESFMEAFTGGFECQELNLANLAYSFSQEAQKLSDCFYATEQDVEILKALYQKGLKLFFQILPATNPVIWKPTS